MSSTNKNLAISLATHQSFSLLSAGFLSTPKKPKIQISLLPFRTVLRSAARLHFCVIILYKGFSPNSFRRVFNYHSGLWLLLSHPILSQTCSKLQNDSIEDNKRIITWKNSFCWPCEGCQVNCRFFSSCLFWVRQADIR